MNASAATGDLWLIRAGGQDYGPYTVDQIKGFIDEGRVQAQTEIAAAGTVIWTTVAMLPVFATLFAPAAPPAVSHVRPPAPGAGAGTASGQRADFLVRVGAILVDGAILLVAQLVLGGILGVIVGDFLSSLAMMVGAVAYFVVLHSQPEQATIGKRVLGLRLVRDDGARISPKLALGRYGAALLSGLILGIGYLLPLFRDDRKTLHDILCNTHVVRLKK